MLDRIKSSITSLTIITSALILVSTVSAVDSVKSMRVSQSTPAGRLTACQARESTIKNRMAHLTALATNMMNKFDRHAARVESYYTTKVVPAGKTVSNYDSLVSDINLKKTAVQVILTKAQNDVQSFNCINGDPKVQMSQFRQDMQAVKRALKDYRTSIKNLIVAVHSAFSGEASESGKMKEKK